MSSEVLRNSQSLSPDLLTKDQQAAITAMYESNTLVVAKMGAGKTVIAATAIMELLNANELKRVLIVTTPKIANTVWCQEFNKWEHTQHITTIAATGTPEQRLTDIKSNAQVTIITFNTLPWMKDNKLFKHFDGLLIDETTKLKTTGGAQFKAIRSQLKKFSWRSGLTGTPVSEDFIALFGQMMLVDEGKALGTNKQKFLDKYFYATDYKQYNWELQKGADKEIIDAIKHITHTVPDYRDTLPPINYTTVKITPPQNLIKYYNDMKKDMITEHAISQTSAVLSQKLQQIASGFVYTEDGEAVALSDFRIKALKELTDKLNTNLIICYWYQEDLQRIKDVLPDAQALEKKRLMEQVKEWNNKEIKTLLIHPRSAGHGIQLEKGGNTIIWFGPQWSNDLWEQTNARVWRQGQQNPVEIYTLSATGTIDELVQQRVTDKAEFDKLFTQHMRT